MRWRSLATRVVLLSYVIGQALALPMGAPAKACLFMVPGHPNLAPETPPPYVVDVSSTTYSPGVPVAVTVRGSVGFQGILLQARPATATATSAGVGVFSVPSAGTKVLTCFTPSDTVTHSMPTLKNSLVVSWTPPLNYAQPVVFVATIAWSKYRWWKDVKSPAITFTPKPAPSPPGQGLAFLRLQRDIQEIPEALYKRAEPSGNETQTNSTESDDVKSGGWKLDQELPIDDKVNSMEHTNVSEADQGDGGQTVSSDNGWGQDESLPNDDDDIGDDFFDFFGSDNNTDVDNGDLFVGMEIPIAGDVNGTALYNGSADLQNAMINNTMMQLAGLNESFQNLSTHVLNATLLSFLQIRNSSMDYNTSQLDAFNAISPVLGNFSLNTIDGNDVTNTTTNSSVLDAMKDVIDSFVSFFTGNDTLAGGQNITLDGPDDDDSPKPWDVFQSDNVSVSENASGNNDVETASGINVLSNVTGHGPSVVGIGEAQPYEHTSFSNESSPVEPMPNLNVSTAAEPQQTSEPYQTTLNSTSLNATKNDDTGNSTITVRNDLSSTNQSTITTGDSSINVDSDSEGGIAVDSDREGGIAVDSDREGGIAVDQI